MGSNDTKWYSEECKRDAIELVRSSGRTVAAVARELGVSSESLRGWVKKGPLVGACMGRPCRGRPRRPRCGAGPVPVLPRTPGSGSPTRNRPRQSRPAPGCRVRVSLSPEPPRKTDPCPWNTWRCSHVEGP
ncbi:transposase [Streptomyces sp. NPDC002476]|uniref:transposase n=1 Tax=Streptomyces sp. NPDC002476 TaxID=3364648 RepID=UPI00368546A4